MNFQDFNKLKKEISEYFRHVAMTKEKNKLKDIHDAIIDRFNKFEPIFRVDYEFQVSKNNYTLETRQKFNKKESVDKVAFSIINKQSKIQLKQDRVLDQCCKVERQFNKTTPMYKITTRPGKSLQKKSGMDLHYGQLLLRGLAEHNKGKHEEDKWFVSPEIPFCARPRANAMMVTAKKIRDLSDDDKSFYTRLKINYQKREIHLLIKIKENGVQEEPKWRQLNEVDSDDIG